MAKDFDLQFDVVVVDVAPTPAIESRFVVDMPFCIHDGIALLLLINPVSLSRFSSWFDRAPLYDLVVRTGEEMAGEPVVPYLGAPSVTAEGSVHPAAASRSCRLVSVAAPAYSLLLVGEM